MREENLESSYAYKCGRLLAALIEAKQGLIYAQSQAESEGDRKVLRLILQRVRAAIQSVND